MKLDSPFFASISKKKALCYKQAIELLWIISVRCGEKGLIFLIWFLK